MKKPLHMRMGPLNTFSHSARKYIQIFPVFDVNVTISFSGKAANVSINTGSLFHKLRLTVQTCDYKHPDLLQRP